MDQFDDLPELLSSSEVAEIFRVSRSTVVSWADKELLPYTRTPSGRLRFYRDGVRALMREQHRDGRKDDA